MKRCGGRRHDSSSISINRHKAKLADGISDGIVSRAFLKLAVHQRVITLGDY
jgi:hypothetical protein